jgi:hypothetical protein
VVGAPWLSRRIGKHYRAEHREHGGKPHWIIAEDESAQIQAHGEPQGAATLARHPKTLAAVQVSSWMPLMDVQTQCFVASDASRSQLVKQRGGDHRRRTAGG